MSFLRIVTSILRNVAIHQSFYVLVTTCLRVAMNSYRLFFAGFFFILIFFPLAGGTLLMLKKKKKKLRVFTSPYDLLPKTI